MQTEMFAISRQRRLADSLQSIAGVGPESITIVINTHLHFDHAGGNTTLSETGQAVPAFANARYFIARDEFAHAEAPSERDRASYLPDNWRPLGNSGQVDLKDADYEVFPGLTMKTSAGHNRSMQCWKLRSGGETLFGFADLVPMRAHVPFACIMGYDLYPVETLEVKKKLLPQAARENWTCLFYHDPDQALARTVEEDRKFVAQAIS